MPRAPRAAAQFPLPGADGWRAAGHDAVRGITIGPIENGYHPGVGYGSAAYARTLDECVRSGATWVAITPFGRVGDLTGRGVDPSFEQPFAKNREDIRRGIAMAHARGLSVMLVPHLWVESGEWRAKIDPPTDAAWDAWTRSYGAFVRGWAEVAEAAHVELFSRGRRAALVGDDAARPELRRARSRIACNLQGSDHLLGELGRRRAHRGARRARRDRRERLLSARGEGRRVVRRRCSRAASACRRACVRSRTPGRSPSSSPEIGYTTRRDPAVRPWEWPDAMKNVRVDEVAQADAYRALIAPLLDEPRFMGFFVWRVYADPDDVSQEAEWGFSPRGKLAELVMRDAFAAAWSGDAARRHGWARAARVPGLFP